MYGEKEDEKSDSICGDDDDAFVGGAAGALRHHHHVVGGAGQPGLWGLFRKGRKSWMIQTMP